MPENTASQKEQSILVENRIHTRIDGITDVNHFDEYEVSMQTEEGELVAEGEELHISLLSVETGKIEIEGKITGIFFSEGQPKKKKSGFFPKK